MFKNIIVIFAVIACAFAKPGPGLVAPLAYSAPLVAAPGVVTATSSQVFARNFNGIATAPVFAAAPVAKYVAAPLAAPLAAAPLAAKYVASPFSARLTYSAPLTAAGPLGYASAYGVSSPLSYASAPLFL